MELPLSVSGPTMQDYASQNLCTWCDGCGDFGIWTAVKRALVESKIQPKDALLCFDVGCHGNMADKIGGYRFHGLHGRVIPLAAGAKISNPNLHVIAFGGDGATFSEGVGHLVHAVRSNYPVTFIMHNNGNYGLTTGQASALTKKGRTMNSSPNGIPEETLNSMDFVFALRPTFVARGFSGDIPQLREILKAALAHRGFAYVDVLQACPTYNSWATHEWLLERCYDVQDLNKYDATDFEAARTIAVDTEEKIATGVLYQNEDQPNFLECLKAREGVGTAPVEEVGIVDVSEILKRFQ
ncbi:MAG: thiamine pyrophosphate-dependent enzyme [Candidatus Peregrinibacteria bacterium]